MYKYDVVSSIVLYNNDKVKVEKAIDSFLNTKLNVKLYLIDNSPTDSLKSLKIDDRIEYVFLNENIGFGAAHNIAIRKSMELSEYHLELNPDIYFKNGVLEKILEYMNKNEDVGLVMPKVLYPTGEIQYLCKLAPTPQDVIFRRFLPFKNIVEKKNFVYELRFADYNNIINPPCLSGCFMFIRNKVFEKVGMFDERFFMYFEDTDLSRRIHEEYKTIYFPEVTIYHSHNKESYRNKKLLSYHIKSGLKYFAKWGWIFDKKRFAMNNEAINRYKK